MTQRNRSYQVIFLVLSALAISHVETLSITPSNSLNKPTSFGSLLLQNTDDILRPFSQKWRCDSCDCGFDKLKNYNQHLEGKKHKAVAAAADALWRDYQTSGSAFYHSSVAWETVTHVWSLDNFLNGLHARSRSSIQKVLTTEPTSSSSNNYQEKGQIDPNIRLEHLSADKSAMLWRLLQSVDDDIAMAAMISALDPKYVRIKELLESLLVFEHIEKLLRRSPQRVVNIYDVGCGHGLVGMLCAAAYPHIEVHSIDRVPRESFQAQRQAFIESGSAMDNLHFVAGDLSVLTMDMGNKVNAKKGHSLVLCVHGCKSLTHESIEFAQANDWAWFSLPCCLQTENHLDAKTNLRLDDDTRFAMLCGAIAAKYNAESVALIDRRITGRGIVLTSSGGARL